MPNLATLGAVMFHSTNIEVGALPRTIGVAANALSREPVQTVDFINGFLPIRVDGMFKPPNALAECAAMKVEVAKPTNLLTVAGTTWRVFKNEDFAFNYELHSAITGLLFFSVTLNCLP